MRKSLVMFFAVGALAGCNAGRQPAETAEAAGTVKAATAEALTLPLEGRWRLTDYAGESEIAEIDTATDYFLQLTAEKTFGMQTGCNSIGGEFRAAGDSLVFGNMATTEMMCADMTVEDAMKRILPMVTTYAITPDSFLVLRSDARIMARFALAAE